MFIFNPRIANTNLLTYLQIISLNKNERHADAIILLWYCPGTALIMPWLLAAAMQGASIGEAGLMQNERAGTVIMCIPMQGRPLSVLYAWYTVPGNGKLSASIAITYLYH